MAGNGEKAFIPEQNPPEKPEEPLVTPDEPAPDLEWEDWDGEEKPALPVELREDLE